MTTTSYRPRTEAGSKGRGLAGARGIAVRLLAPIAVLVAGLSVTIGSAGADTAASGALTWSVMSGGSPSLSNPAMAYDDDNHTVVLFGGAQADGTPSGQTWIFNGKAWSQPSGLSGPAARTGASLAFDAARHQLILFGGVDANGSYLNDTWAWNGAQWFALSPTGNVPPGRAEATLAADPAGNLMLFAGTGAVPAQPTTSVSSLDSTTTAAAQAGATTATLDDTWTWNGTSWTAITAAQSPPARTDAAATFDPAHSQTVLFGGDETPGPVSPTTVQLADTWTWDGATWTQAAPSTSPSGRSGAALVGDPSLGGAVLFGGSVGTAPAADTWTWDGATWTAQSPPGSPPALSEIAGAFDTSTGQVIVCGGGGGSLVLGASPAQTPPSTTPPTSAPPGPVVSPVTTLPTTTTAPPTSTTTVVQKPTQVATPGSTTSTPAKTTPTSAKPTRQATPAPRPASPPKLVPGAQFVLAGSGYKPYSLVDISFHSVPQHLLNVQTDGHGDFNVTVTVPVGADIGSHHFMMSGTTAAGTSTTQVRAVLVEARLSSRHGSGLQTPVMVAISLLLPLGTWAVAGAALGRRRPRPPEGVAQ